MKREVRFVASTLLVVLPMSWGLFAFPKIGSGLDTTKASTATTIANAPAPTHPHPQLPVAADLNEELHVTIGLSTAPIASPSTTSGTPESEAPIVAPAGYLVPDESPEEASHEGR